MDRMMSRCLAALTVLALPAAAQAGPYADCEKYQEPLAYNQCLASHGPSALHALAATPQEEGAGTEIQGIRGLQSARPFRQSHGRMSATFEIGGSHMRRRR